MTNFITITLFYKCVKASRHATPWPFTPAPTWSPVDCDVVGRWHQAEQSKSSAWCQNGPCYLPPRMPKIHRFPPPKSEAATPSPGRFRPRQRGRQLIVMSLGGGIRRNSQNRPHGAKMAPVAHPPERLKYFDSPLLKAKPPRHPPAIPAQTPPPYV